MSVAVATVVVLTFFAPRFASGDNSESAKISLDWPVCAESSLDFGYARNSEKRKLRYHVGVDFGAAHDLDVRASAPGTVTTVQRRPRYGLIVEVYHGLGVMTRYANLSTVLVKQDDTLAQGQIIGRVSSAALGRQPETLIPAWPKNAKAPTPPPHLHFEVLVWTVPYDPLQFLCPGEGCRKVHRSLDPKGLPSLPVAEACTVVPAPVQPVQWLKAGETGWYQMQTSAEGDFAHAGPFAAERDCLAAFPTSEPGAHHKFRCRWFLRVPPRS